MCLFPIQVRQSYSQVSHSHYAGTWNPDTGANTQGIERAWLDTKGWYKRSRWNRVYLQSHLDEASYSRIRTPETRSGTLFGAFLNYLGHWEQNHWTTTDKPRNMSPCRKPMEHVVVLSVKHEVHKICSSVQIDATQILLQSVGSNRLRWWWSNVFD